MMYFLQNDCTDPYFNLALEQHIFDNLDCRHSYFMLWQNDNAIIVGKHQNTVGEINAAYVRDQGIAVVRRLSGGGAVYHDLGNLNFSFIADGGDQGFDFSTFCQPVARALATLGVAVEFAGRNDMTIEGKKFSGNAQYMKRGRVMHHGTILYDSDLGAVGRALRVSKDKIESKGIKSVQSRVTNIKPYMAQDLPIARFCDALRDFMFKEYNLQTYNLTPEDIERVQDLRDTVYSQWSWNYGVSPAYSIRKERRVEGCGVLEIHMDVKEGKIEAMALYGDYFGNGDPAELARQLQGCPLEEEALRRTLSGTDLGLYCNNLNIDAFVSALLC